MRAFIARQEMLWISTTNSLSESDCTFRGGPPGFVRVIGERRLAYPEYWGNGAGESGAKGLNLCGTEMRNVGEGAGLDLAGLAVGLAKENGGW